MLNLIKKYIHFIEKHTIICLLIGFSLIFISIPFILKLEIKPSFQDILPDDHSSVKNIKKLTEVYGGEGFFVVGLENGQKEDLIEFSEKINTLSKSYSTISYVFHRIDYDFFEKNFLLYMDLSDLKKVEKRVAKQIAKLNPLYVELNEEDPSSFVDDILTKYNLSNYNQYLMDEKETSLICLLKPSGSPNNISFSKQLTKDIDEIIDSIKSEKSEFKSIEVQYGGLYYEVYIDNIEILNNIYSLSILSVIITTFVLLFHYRRFKSIVIILFPLIIGIIFNFALAQLLIGSLNMLTGFLSGILIGLGLDFGIHLYSRYLLEKQSHPWKDALANSIANTGIASLGGALTTASAFYGITISDFKGFNEFGFIAGNGILLTSFSIMLFFPVVIVIYERLSHISVFKIKGTLNQFSYKKKRGGFYKKFRFNYPYIRVLFLFVTVFSIYFALQLRYENDFSKIKGKSAELRTFTDKTEAILKFTVKPIIIMSTNPDVINQLATIYTENISNNTFEIMASCQSIGLFIPKDQNKKLAIIKRLKKTYQQYSSTIDTEINDPYFSSLIRSGLKAKKITLNNLPEEIRKQFVSKDGKTYFLIVHGEKHIYRYIPKLRIFQDEIESVEHLKGQFQSAGITYILTSIQQMIKEETRYILITVLIAVFFTIFILFRKIKDVFIIFSTLSFGILIMLGIMGFANVRFNLLNMIALPIILGIGVDGAIHICHRLNEFKGEAPHLIMDQILQVILLSSFTTAIGLVTLNFASYTGLQSIGTVTVIGLISTIISSLFFLPAFLNWFYPSKKDDN